MISLTLIFTLKIKMENKHSWDLKDFRHVQNRHISSLHQSSIVNQLANGNRIIILRETIGEYKICISECYIKTLGKDKQIWVTNDERRRLLREIK